ncbi:hypothetical protein FOA24_31885 [Bacillus thuringiensis]|uniref:insecticidal delta-endotoxin Cry8Ea1 family protein n=1 Tax=Bacillus thuringiensis TaxID=1428 RepID=UPI003334BB25
MNQNCNNNGYEILDSGGMSYQPRYPYAKAPGAEFQQMNYKDGINQCKWGESGELFANDLDPVRDMLIISTGIGWALLGFVPGIGPALAAVAGVLNVAIPYLWPEEAGPPGTPQAQFSWNQIMTAAEQITNKAIDAQVRAEAITELQGIQEAIRLYRDAACDWKNDPNNSQLQETLRTQFIATNTVLFNRMPSFRVAGFETSLLPTFVQAATLHLGLLRDGAKFGLQWGLNPATVNRYYGYLTSNIATYTDYCTSWYSTGLQEQYNTGNWTTFNDFRRDMTISVLDIVAVWPTFDINLYAVPTSSQLTRTVYTPLQGNLGGNALSWETPPSIDVIEENLVDTPGLFKWLHKVLFESIDGLQSPVIKGRGIRYEYTMDNSIIDGGYQGEHGTKTETLPITLPTGSEDKYMPIGDVWHVTNQLYQLWLVFPDRTDVISAVRGFLFRGIPHAAPVFYDINYRVQGQSGLPCRGMDSVCETCESNCTPQLPNGGSICNSGLQAGNRLSYVGLGMLTAEPGRFVYSSTRYAAYFGYGWTHVSADANNLIDAEKITQIPAVKGYSITGDASVIKGPGSTGGDLVQLSSGNQGRLSMWITSPPGSHAYRVRIRYASDIETEVYIFTRFDFDNFTAEATTTDVTNLTYNKFRYLETISYDYEQGEMSKDYLTIVAEGSGSGSFILDKIEFIPIEGSFEAYQADQDLEKAKKAVNALFTGGNVLQLNVTDYAIDQAANLVECLSDEFCVQEKMILLDQVKLAKRFSQARNLLNYGDFESPDWSGENGWRTSNHVNVLADNPIFKGHYLNMPGANQPQFSNKVFPTYAYQKIEEAKLKPYTRYMVRGFVGNSKGLEVFVARYDKEVYKKMNVRNDRILTNPCTGEYLLQPTPYPVMASNSMSQNMWCNPCGNGYGNGAGMMAQNMDMMCQDPHEFKFHIDTGELDMERNLGIWLGFKIGTADGRATLSNIEVVEVGPLTGEALTRMQKREPKWKKKWAEKRMEIEKAVQTARNAIQTLFTDPNQNRLQSAITLKNIVDADKWVQKVPYVYNQFLQGALPEVPGETYDIFQRLSNAIATARGLYGQRNVLINGDFTAGLSNWHGTDGAAVQQIGNASILAIADWGANLSQHVRVNPEHGYVLRVTARKEGSGEGYVTISDGTKDNTETLKFMMGEETTGATMSTIRSNIRERYNERNMATPEAYGASGYASNQNMVNYPSESYGTNAYSNNNMNYQSESFGMNPYGDENSMMNGSSNKYEANGYPGNNNMNYPSESYGTNAYSNNNMNYQSKSFGMNPYGDENNMTNYPSENYRENAYSGNNNMYYPSNNYEMNAYSSDMNVPMNQETDCGCGCSTNAYPGGNMMMNNYSSSTYETNTYPNSTNMTNNQGMGCGCHYSADESPMVEENTPDLSGYVTKTVEIFPETNRVCIEIGETAGTFMVESIELIQMDCE